MTGTWKSGSHDIDKPK